MRGSDPGRGLTLVGVGPGGLASLAPAVAELLISVGVVVGDPDLLAQLPARRGPSFAQRREPWPRPLDSGLPALLARHRGERVVLLVPGDPLRTRRGARLLEVARERGVSLRVEPPLDAGTLARARLGWPDADVLDLRAHPVTALVRELSPGRRLVVLPGSPRAVDDVTALLAARGYGASRVTPLSTSPAPEPAFSSPGPVWALGLELVGPLVSPWAAGLPDEALEGGEGGLTPSDLRAAALARLAPQPGQVLWDLGSGGAGVAVEWLRAHPTCRAVALAPDPARAAAAGRNAVRHGVPGLEVVVGDLRRLLAGRAAPDAVFVGAHLGDRAQRLPVDAALALLAPGGRLVVQSAAAPEVAALAERYAVLGGALTRLATTPAGAGDARTGEVAWADPVEVTQWAWQRPA